MSEDKKADSALRKQNVIKGTKARGFLVCDVCSACRVVHSMYEPGSQGEPKTRHMDKFYRLKEDGGYVCGNEVSISNLHVLRGVRCHDPIESSYYCAGKDRAKRRGGRVVTEDICCLCYSKANLVPFDEVKKRQKDHVKNPLPVCYSCLSLNVKLPGGGMDYTKKRANAKTQRAALRETAMKLLRRQCQHQGMSRGQPIQHQCDVSISITPAG